MVSVQEAETILMDVPEDKRFGLYKGTEISNIEELADAFDIMDDEMFSHHVKAHKNDFSSWIKEVIHDEKLAFLLHKAKTKQEAAAAINARVKELENVLYKDQIESATWMKRGVVDILIGMAIGIIIGLVMASFF